MVAALVTLFGVPVLVLGVAFAFNEPKSLAVALPICLLLPGVRDVLLHVAVDIFRGAARARRFVSDSEAEDAEDAREQQERQRRQRWQQQAKWSRPPPPPPPPAADYELRRGEYNVYPPPPGTPSSPFAHGWPLSVQVPRSPFADGWPPSPSSGPGSPSSSAYPPPPDTPSSPFAHGWPPSVQVPRSPFADGWPPGPTPSASSSVSWQQAPPGGSRSWPASSDAAGGDGGGAGRLRPYGRASATPPRPPSRGPGVAGGHRASRLVRPASKARVGLDVGGRKGGDATPLLLRPIFALVPFLRWWGGFL
ncbi:hypothetical protein CHLNCDRAFT_139923 [Chlorella variabilis]|uniref:Uncharacterized protein n=1 Tax=Chlorella variabilis TaxID=554065 RepID=E1ZR79_CHLVA|nr:hypothetical protein CHLNCDRAFT_139923 [Chlorella variabilis]EFN51686.1 hypothetical protein CHLNCDRAFT_139923 [Chlorella variabilis]|eukprot:XP_005843788.1 hypothetical protein CHLNCDRAFT_139923 [Chlorella variabilis]